jgi:peptidoglycan/LPS O-acetylase OafA/YrhL
MQMPPAQVGEFESIPVAARPPRIWFVQVLRAVACLMVVAMHYGGGFVTEPQAISRLCLFPPLTDLPRLAYLRPILWMTSYGIFPSAVGVALFFLVSGFVIPYSLQRNGLGGFAIRRFFRIYPTLWVVQILVLTTLAWQAHKHGIAFPYRPALVASNALLINSYLGHLFIEGVCWTLLVEEMFYLICSVCAWRRVLDNPATVLLVSLGLTGIALVSYHAADMPGIHAQIALYWLVVTP